MAAPAARRSGDGGAGPDAPAVHAIGLRKTYGDVVALERLDLAVRAGEFFTLLGPSGSGKTTTLRLIGGFERPDSGAIELGVGDGDGGGDPDRPQRDRAVRRLLHQRCAGTARSPGTPC